MIPDMIGLKFGRLTVIERAPNSGKFAAWYCSCSCGTEKTKPIRGFALRNGSTKSCGCLLREILCKRNYRHGCTRHFGNINRRTPEYISWGAMVQRCTNPKHRFYGRYGGIGITICDRWLKFENFLADIGLRPSQEYSIGRNDNNLGYEPNNCKWMTPDEQVNNKSNSRYVTIGNETKSIAQWCRKLDIDPKVVHARIHRGRTLIEALLTPVEKNQWQQKKKCLELVDLTLDVVNHKSVM